MKLPSFDLDAAENFETAIVIKSVLTAGSSTGCFSELLVCTFAACHLAGIGTHESHKWFISVGGIPTPLKNMSESQLV